MTNDPIELNTITLAAILIALMPQVLALSASRSNGVRRFGVPLLASLSLYAVFVCALLVFFYWPLYSVRDPLTTTSFKFVVLLLFPIPIGVLSSSAALFVYSKRLPEERRDLFERIAKGVGFSALIMISLLVAAFVRYYAPS